MIISNTKWTDYLANSVSDASWRCDIGPPRFFNSKETSEGSFSAASKPILQLKTHFAAFLKRHTFCIFLHCSYLRNIENREKTRHFLLFLQMCDQVHQDIFFVGFETDSSSDRFWRTVVGMSRDFEMFSTRLHLFSKELSNFNEAG